MDASGPAPSRKRDLGLSCKKARYVWGLHHIFQGFILWTCCGKGIFKTLKSHRQAADRCDKHRKWGVMSCLASKECVSGGEKAGSKHGVSHKGSQTQAMVAVFAASCLFLPLSLLGSNQIYDDDSCLSVLLEEPASPS